jgi:tetratricopeptide (TPR) repeat protein
LKQSATTVRDLNFELFRTSTSKRNYEKKLLSLLSPRPGALCCAVVQARNHQRTKEANKLPEGAEASKNQEWDKAVDLLRKATALDHKYAPNLAAVYQQRGYAAATNQQFQDAINDFGEAIKINPEDPRIYEQRAAVEMKLNDMDKALADYY